MDDLISRAAAIEALDHERELLIEQERYGAEHIVVHHAQRIIEEVPAVDAIQAGWLIDRANDLERAPLYRRYAQMLYEEWNKEQEAR